MVSSFFFCFETSFRSFPTGQKGLYTTTLLLYTHTHLQKYTHAHIHSIHCMYFHSHGYRKKNRIACLVDSTPFVIVCVCIKYICMRIIFFCPLPSLSEFIISDSSHFWTSWRRRFSFCTYAGSKREYSSSTAVVVVVAANIYAVMIE